MSMDMDTPSELPPSTGGPDDAGDDAALLALAQAIGARLRVLPEAGLMAQHIERAAEAARRGTESGAGTHSGPDRAPASESDASGGDAGRRPGAARPGGRAGRLRRLQSSLAAIAVLVAGIATWVSSSRDDLPMIALGSMSGASAAAPGDAAMSREADVAADQPAVGFLWMPTDYTFILEESARVAAGTAPAWRFAAPGDLAALAERLSARFGLPALAPSEWDPATLTVTSDAGSLTLSPTGEWYFGAAYDPAMEWRCPADDEPARECEPPPPAVGVPSTEEARRLAAALFDELGIGGVRLEDAFVDAWTASVWGLIGVEGAPRDVGLSVGAGFGGDGRIQYANGSFARAVGLGDYPTVSSEAALERFRLQLARDSGTAQPYPADGPAADGPRQDGASVLPAPGDDVERQDVERQQVTVRLVSAEVVLQFVWTADQQMILAPHYRFRDTDGGEWWVIAVEDRYLAS
jgi:hypothetical protein